MPGPQGPRLGCKPTCRCSVFQTGVLQWNKNLVARNSLNTVIYCIWRAYFLYSFREDLRLSKLYNTCLPSPGQSNNMLQLMNTTSTDAQEVVVWCSLLLVKCSIFRCKLLVASSSIFLWVDWKSVIQGNTGWSWKRWWAWKGWMRRAFFSEADLFTGVVAAGGLVCLSAFCARRRYVKRSKSSRTLEYLAPAEHDVTLCVDLFNHAAHHTPPLTTCRQLLMLVRFVFHCIWLQEHTAVHKCFSIGGPFWTRSTVGRRSRCRRWVSGATRGVCWMSQPLAENTWRSNQLNGKLTEPP